jgi:RimJ/RimL family protein N-acetyltransferase
MFSASDTIRTVVQVQASANTPLASTDLLSSRAWLETTRLVMRLPEADDAVPLMEIHHDPQAVKYIVFGAGAGGVTAAWRNIAIMLGHWHLRGYGQWTVIEKETSEIIGRVGLWHPAGWPGMDLGWIIRRSRWGNGFATEAARGALDWTWQHVRTDHIISVIQPDNLPSIRVAEKIGQRFERVDQMNGNDVKIYGIRRRA